MRFNNLKHMPELDKNQSYSGPVLCHYGMFTENHSWLDEMSHSGKVTKHHPLLFPPTVICLPQGCTIQWLSIIVKYHSHGSLDHPNTGNQQASTALLNRCPSWGKNTLTLEQLETLSYTNMYWSILWLLMTWCFSTRSSATTILIHHIQPKHNFMSYDFLF